MKDFDTYLKPQQAGGEHWEWYIYRQAKIKESRVIGREMSNWRFRRNKSQLSVYLHLNFLEWSINLKWQFLYSFSRFLDYDKFNSYKQNQNLLTSGLDEKLLLIEEKISSTYQIDEWWKFVSFGLNEKFLSMNKKISSTFQINKRWKFVFVSV